VMGFQYKTPMTENFHGYTTLKSDAHNRFSSKHISKITIAQKGEA
jgi:hypothetical protein